MQLDMTTCGDWDVAYVNAERLDALVSVQFKDAVRDAAVRVSERLVLDVEMVQFMDSSGLGAVVGAMKQIAPKRLEFVNMQPPVMKVFQLTRMDRVFAIHDGLPARHDLGALHA